MRNAKSIEVVTGRTGRATAAVKNVMFLSAVETPFSFAYFSFGRSKRKVSLMTQRKVR